MVKNLLARKPEQGHRPKVLLLGISYPSVHGQMDKRGFDHDILSCKEPSVDQAVECVRRGILTEMDARDLARCVATEQAGLVDVYSVSKEIGAVYREDRHVHGNFNARNFCSLIKKAFGEDIQFSQVILDYYWMPTGWLVTRWARTLFQKTLPELVKSNMLTFPSKRSRRRTNDDSNSLEEGVIYLPFCAHVAKELVGAIDTLEKYFAISFVNKSELAVHSLWKGTMDIDGEVMQTRLGKRLDQEEVYCTFRPKDIHESMEDPHVSKPAVMRILLAIEDYENVRMIRLKPLRQHEPPSVMKERLSKPEIGGFKGLNFNLEKNRKKQELEKKNEGLVKIRVQKKLEIEVKKEAKKLEIEVRKEVKKLEIGAKKEAKKLQVGAKKAAKKLQVETKKLQVEAKKKKNIKVEEPKKKAKRKTKEQPAGRGRTCKKPKGPVYEDVEEVSESEFERLKVPKFTYFFPYPAKNLETYNEPENMAQADRRRRPKKKKKTPVKDMHVVEDSSDDEQERRHAKLWKQPKQYLAYNPRNPPAHKRISSKAPGSLVFDLCVPEDLVPEDDALVEEPKDKELEGAVSLFFGLRKERQAVISRKILGEEEIACYKMKTKEMKDMIGTDKNGGLEVDEEIDSVPIFEAVVDACRGDLITILEKKDRVALRNLRYDLGKTNVKMDRVANMERIVRWYVLGRSENDDPSGCFALLNSEPKPIISEELWRNVKLLEAKLFHELKSLSPDGLVVQDEGEENMELRQAVKRYQSLVQSTFEDRDGAAIVHKFQYNLEEERARLRQNVLKWLQDKQEANDPTGEFGEYDAKLPKTDGQDLDDRAKEMALRIEIIRNVVGHTIESERKSKTGEDGVEDSLQENSEKTVAAATSVIHNSPTKPPKKPRRGRRSRKEMDVVDSLIYLAGAELTKERKRSSNAATKPKSDMKNSQSVPDGKARSTPGRKRSRTTKKAEEDKEEVNGCLPEVPASKKDNAPSKANGSLGTQTPQGDQNEQNTILLEIFDSKAPKTSGKAKPPCMTKKATVDMKEEEPSLLEMPDTKAPKSPGKDEPPRKTKKVAVGMKEGMGFLLKMPYSEEVIKPGKEKRSRGTRKPHGSSETSSAEEAAGMNISSVSQRAASGSLNTLGNATSNQDSISHLCPKAVGTARRSGYRQSVVNSLMNLKPTAAPKIVEDAEYHDMLRQMDVTRQQYENMLGEFRCHNGGRRSQTLNLICLWLAHQQNKLLDPTGEFEDLNRLLDRKGDTFLLQRGMEIEAFLDYLGIKGIHWNPRQSKYVDSDIRDIWRRVIDGGMLQILRQVLNQAGHQPSACVSPSPPNSVYEGWGGERTGHGMGRQMMLASTPARIPPGHFVATPISPAQLSNLPWAQLGNLPWVSVRKAHHHGESPHARFY